MRQMHKQYTCSYQCIENTCSRVFLLLRSFRSHFQRDHERPNLQHPCASEDLPYENYDDSSQVDNMDVEEETNQHTCKDNYPGTHAIPEISHNSNLNEMSVFHKQALKIASNFHGDMTLNRSQAERVIQNFDNFLNSDSVNSLKSLILESVDNSAYSEIAQRFNDFQSSFSSINTEYKCFKKLREAGCLIEPEKITYNFRDEPAAGQSAPIIVDKKNSGSIIPLPALLKKFFELPNVLVETLNYMSLLESTENNEFSNIIQTELWKNKTAGIEEIVLPIFLYEDDFECGNPLGSHATIYKMAGMYLSLPCLPPQFRSKLDNIFLVQIAHAQDIASNPDSVIYNDTINMLNNLSTSGIEIEAEQRKYKLFFKLALMAGDNLGLNRILGFKTHFNSDFFCRFCKATLKETNNLTTQDDSLLRDLNTYEQDTKEKPIPQQSGIVQKCIWNNVMDFHVVTNFSIDIMHDLFEGVCRYNFGYMLPYFIKKNFFS